MMFHHSLNSKKLMNKRGSLLDPLVIIISLFFVAIIIVALAPFNTAIGQLFTGSSGVNIPQQAKDIVTNYSNRYVSVWDGVFLLLYVGITVVTALAARSIDTHPVFFSISAMLLILTVFIGAALAGSWQALENTDFGTTIAQFTIIPFFLEQWQYFALISGTIIAIALYAKPSAGGF